MSFKIVDVEFYKSPCSAEVDDIISSYGISCKEIENALKEGTYRHSKTNEGFQKELHEQLKFELMLFFKLKGHSISSQRYSREFDLESDVAVPSKTSGKGIYIEIEFRDKNQFADIVKFQIGYKHDLELGVLVVPKNKKNINPGYKTMIEFHNCKDVLEALELEVPILLIGFDGIWKNAE